LGAAAFGVPLVLLPASTFTTLPKLLTMVAMSGILLLLFAWRLAGSGADSRGAGWPLLALLVAVPSYILVRLLLGTFSDMAEIRLLLVASGCLGLASMTVLLEGRLRAGAAWMVLLGGASGLAVSVLTGLGAMDWLGVYPAASHRLSGSFGNANLLGSWAAGLLPFGLALLLAGKEGRALRITGAAALAALCLAALQMSATRASLVALAGGVGVTVLITAVRRRRKDRPPGRGLRTALILVVAVVLAVLLLGGRVADFDAAGTLSVRRVIWTGAAGMVSAEPLMGWGPGAFQRTFPLYRPPDYAAAGVSHNTAHAHSEPLETLAEEGAAGLLLWLVLLVAWSRRVLRGLEDDPVRVGAFASAAVLLLESLVSVSLRWTSSVFLLTVMAFLALDSRPGARLPRWAAPVPAAAGLALLLLGGNSVIRLMDASRHLYTAKVECLDRLGSAGPEGRLEMARRAVQQSREALDANPDDMAAAFTLGNALLLRAELLAEDPGDMDEAVSSARSALAAYDSLARAAPEFAQMRLNRVHVCLKLGMFDRALEDLSMIYLRRSHSRDYCRDLGIPISPLSEGYDAWVLITCLNRAALMRGLAESAESEGGRRRVERLLESLQYNMALAMRGSGLPSDSLMRVTLDIMAPAGDSLLARMERMLQAEAEASEGAEALLGRLERGEDVYAECTELLSRTEAYAPFHRYARCVSCARSGDTAALEEARKLTWDLRCLSLPLLQLWPGHGDHLLAGVQMAMAAGPDSHLEDLEAFLNCALELDLRAYRAFSSARSSCLRRPQCGVDTLEWIALEIGGPMAGRLLAECDELMPPGGMLARMDQLLSGQASAAVLELRAGLLCKAFCLAMASGAPREEIDAAYRESVAGIAAELASIPGGGDIGPTMEAAALRQRGFLAGALDEAQAGRLLDECLLRTRDALSALGEEQP